MPINIWFKKVYTYTMEYSSAIKKGEILPFAAIWMDLENIVLSSNMDGPREYHPK